MEIHTKSMRNPYDIHGHRRLIEALKTDSRKPICGGALCGLGSHSSKDL